MKKKKKFIQYYYKNIYFVKNKIGDLMKKILITGARSGIGNALVNSLIDKEYYIYLTVHNESQLSVVKEKYKEYSNIKCLKLDVTLESDRLKIEKLDIDILVNIAGVGYGGSISEIPMNKVRENFEVNVFSSFELVQIVLKQMIMKKKGKIIIMSSLAGILPLNFLGSYCATKASIIQLTTTLKNELKLLNTNIKIVLIEPGMYHTGFNQVMLENKYDWMKEKSYFENELNLIRKRENLFFGLLEKNKLNSIVKKIVKAIEAENPKFIYRAPLIQVLGAKLYQMFKM